MKELKLLPPSDPRVQSAIAPFHDDMLKEHDIKDRQELEEAMFFVMKKFGGIGLTCNQVGLPFNMFVAGGHEGVEKGMSLATDSASAAEAIAAADRARKKAMILDTGDGRAMEAVYGKLSKGSKTTVMAKGCKLGRKRRTIIT